MKKQNVRVIGQHFFSSALLLTVLLTINARAEKAQSFPVSGQIFPPHTQKNPTFPTAIRFTTKRTALFLSPEEQRQRFVFKALQKHALEKNFGVMNNLKANANDRPKATAASNDPQRMQSIESRKIQWKEAFSQSLKFLWIQHGFRLLTEPGTRDELKGPFFKDWLHSVKNTRGWRDGDPFLVNYIGHPMQGSVTGYIFVHNDPTSARKEFELKKDYFKSRIKAMLFSTMYSTQFELGPFSEASLGNVGLRPSPMSKHPSALVDLVVTPTLGTVWMMGEDALDRHVVKWIEEHTENRVARILVRCFLNPTRSTANMLRGRWMWYRDGRGL